MKHRERARAREKRETTGCQMSDDPRVTDPPTPHPHNSARRILGSASRNSNRNRRVGAEPKSAKSTNLGAGRDGR
eukprot:2487263-Rhodomonas_salina.1